MTPALRYLLSRSLANGIVARLKRLRQPKYLLAAVLGGAYFYFYFYKFLFGGFGATRQGGVPVLNSVSWEILAAGILLVATLLLSWILPASRAAITFTEAEIAFFFPAPISRRVLIIHKLLKSQLGFLFIATMITFLTGRFRAGSVAWYQLAGWWVILNTLSMHRIAASFALQRLKEWGMADGRRRLAAVVLLAGIAGIIYTTWRALPPLPEIIAGAVRKPDFNALISQLSEAGPLPYVLAPFRWVVGPYFAGDFGSFLAAMAPALGIMLLHFAWVLRADVSFEEASIAAAQKRAVAVDSLKRGEFRIRSAKARTPMWRLRPTGFAPMAFLWKSLIKFGGRRTLRLWALVFMLLGTGAFFIQANAGQSLPGWVATIGILVGIGCYATILISFIMVGQAATSQLRQGLAAMDLIKTYPIPGWQIALGELAGPLLLGSLLQWAALGIGAMLASSVAPGGGTIIAISAAGLAVLLPAFNVSMSILPCAAALMFPAWFKPAEAGTQGLEATGMRLIVGIAQFAALAAMLVPVAFFGACAWMVFGQFGASLLWQSVAAGGLGAVVLAAEAAVGVQWLGSLYDSYDAANA